MNYKFCELYNKYIILSKYEQNTHFIQLATCLRAFPLLWNVASARNVTMRFHCATVLVILSICAP